MTQLKRPDWDTYFLNLAQMVATRSSCIRRQVGAVLVKDKQIIATGYSGTPRGVTNCDEGGCKRCLDREKNIIKTNERKDLCICIHAEQNVILQAAYHGISTKDTFLYVTVSPCIQCALLIINAGVRKVVYKQIFQDDLGLKMLQSVGIEVKSI